MSAKTAIRKAMGPLKKRLNDYVAALRVELADEQQVLSWTAGDVEDRIYRLTGTKEKYFSFRTQLAKIAERDEEEQARIADEEEEVLDISFEVESVTRVLKEKHSQLSERTSQNPESSVLRVSDSYTRVKLPKLEPLRFSGNVTQWPEFWDSFASSVGDNPLLRPIDKFCYLRGLLRGDAIRCIEGLQVTDANYEQAVSLLKSRFANNSIIIHKLYENLKNVKKATNDSRSLRETYDVIEKTLRSLESLGEDISHTHFRVAIMTKLPTEFKLRLEERQDTDSLSISELRELIGKMILIREKLEILKEKPISVAVSEGSKLKGTTDSLVVFNRQCRFCSENHWSDQCQVFPSLEARKKVVQQKNMCFICLSQKHKKARCVEDKPCYYCKKRKSHHRSLCWKITHAQSKGDEPKTIVESCSTAVQRSVLQTAVVDVANVENGIRKRVNMIFDSGSQRTYVTKKLASALKLHDRVKDQLSIFVFGSSKPKTIESSRVELHMKLRDGNNFVLEANVVPKIIENFQRNPLTDMIKKRMNDIEFADLPDGSEFSKDIDLLIGNDYFYDLIELRKNEIEQGVYLIESKLGWLLGGRVSEEHKRLSNSTLQFLTYVMSSSEIDVFTKPDFPLINNEVIDLKRFWELELIGIKESPEEKDDDVAINQFIKGIELKSNRYFVSWPWKIYPPELKDNYKLALGRLKTLSKRLLGSSEIREKYTEIIQDQAAKGIIEEVDSNTSENSIKHYLPHHPVLTPQKSTTKVRVVYDASAKERKSDFSLNQCLLRGRIILEDLCSLLLRFRMNKIALTADIEKAFLQVGLHEHDRDVTRFLWLKDPTKTPTPENIKIMRFTRVPFGVISSPFLLNAVIQYHLNTIDTNNSKYLAKCFYMDNLVCGANSVEEAVALYNDTKRIFNTVSMNIREWSTNSSAVLKEITPNDLGPRDVTSILGLKWNIEEDSLEVKGSQRGDCAISKRAILKYVSSIFDPMGFLAPTTLLGKLFIRKLWELNVGWDDVLDKDLQQEWQDICLKISFYPEIKINRCLGIENAKNFEIHCFTDASKLAYAAVVYLKFDTALGTFVKILFSKARVSPVKIISIPRLELLGVIIGLRLLRFIRDQMNLNDASLFIWTDSKCVLQWIHSKKRPLPLFVERRIKEIDENGNEVEFLYVPGNENPADLATRGISAQDLKDEFAWWNGPSWLKDRSQWPFREFGEKIENLSDDFGIDKPDNLIKSYVTMNVHKNISPFEICHQNYSNLFKLYRITAYCRLFVDKLRGIHREKQDIDCEDIENAKTNWECFIQMSCLSEVYQSLTRDKPTGSMKYLGLFLDNRGLVRCKGRLVLSDLSEEQKYPKLLPSKDYFTELVIIHNHKRLLHSGVQSTLNSIRREYWIPKGRSVVNNVLRKCLTCKRYLGGPYRVPIMPPFPSFRVTKSLPFEYVGLDGMGPLLVRNKDGNRKVWLYLFTCLVTRGIHMELVPDFSGEQFLMAFRRFISRRGKPTYVISDNAKQFKFSKRIIQEVNKELKWHFIPEYSPWMGGVYESMIRMVKMALKKTLGNLLLTTFQLATVVTEIEAVVNSRPLVYLTDDAIEEALTPSHFLSVRKDTILEFDVEEEEKEKSEHDIRLLWKKGQKHVDRFWNIWRDSYLTSLRERRSSVKQGKICSKFVPNIGDVVHVREDQIKRQKWKMGVVTELQKSEDGKIRSTIIKMTNGKLIIRPIMRLYPIETDGRISNA